MTRTHVIILAQEQQPRVLDVPPQWLRLPGTGPTARGPGVPILMRTIAQISHLASRHSAPLMTGPEDIAPISVTVVCGAELRNLLAAEGDRLIGAHTHAEPCNSSLKDIDSYLRFRFARPSPHAVADERIVVLLGDGVYSWACMRALLCSQHPISFVGTSNLSRSRGDLWGVTWETDDHAIMVSLLETALAKPPCGGLRQWFFAGQADPRIADSAQDRPVVEYVTAVAVLRDHLYHPIDDYTQRIDDAWEDTLRLWGKTEAEHPELLDLGRQAAADDEKNGLVW